MAYTSVIPVRRLDRAVKYVMNKEKTTAGILTGRPRLCRQPRQNRAILF